MTLVNFPRLLEAALTCLHGGRNAEAVLRLRSVASLAPDHVDGLQLLAVAQSRLGVPQQAVHLLRRALRADARSLPAALNLMLIARGTGSAELAARTARHCLALDPASAPAFETLLSAQGGPDALRAGRPLLVLAPDRTAVAVRLAGLARDAGDRDAAAALYRHAVLLDPQQPAALFNLALVENERNDLDAAVAAYRRALRLDPTLVPALVNLANLLQSLGRLDEQGACLRRAIALQPDCWEALFNLGAWSRFHAPFGEGLACFRRAEALRPGSTDWGLAYLYLHHGRLEEGFRKYEVRHKPVPQRPDPIPEWDGAPLDGRTILLMPEQGFGDVLQFCRYAPLVAGRGGRVLVAAPPALKRLLATLPGVNAVVNEDGPPPPADVWCSIISLPARLGTSLETIPAGVPYLRAAPEAVSRWRRRLPETGGRRVGLVWAGSPRAHLAWSNRTDRRRSLPLAALAPLATVQGCTFFSLQKGTAAAQRRDAAPLLPLTDWMDEIDDFADTAALVDSLDLVITVDTSMAHLAGALGRPVWMLSRFDGCWRWLADREDSPWYPTMRIFRQPAPGDWDSVVAAVRRALAAWAG